MLLTEDESSCTPRSRKSGGRLYRFLFLAFIVGIGPGAAWAEDPTPEELDAAVAEEIGPLRLFPRAAFAFEPDPVTPAPDSVFLHVIDSDGVEHPPTEALPDGEGAYTADFACPTLGEAMLEIRSGVNSGSEFLMSIPILCEAARRDATLASAFAAAAESESPTVIRGVIDSFVEEEFSRMDSFSTRNPPSPFGDIGFFREVLRRTTRTGAEECRFQLNRKQNQIGGEIFETSGEFCFEVEPNATEFPFFDTVEFNNHTDSFVEDLASSANVRSIQNSIAHTRLDLTLAFPDLQEGDVIESLKLVLSDGGAILPQENYAANGVPVELTLLEAAQLPCRFTDVRGEWNLPADTLTIEFRAVEQCPDPNNGTHVIETEIERHTTTQDHNQGRLFGRRLEFFGVLGSDDLSLELEPMETNVEPEYPSFQDSTEIRAMVMGGDPGATHTVNFSLNAFDALGAGHNHGNGVPPQSLWGELAGAATGSCEVTMNDATPPEGSCEIEFSSDPVAGSLTVVGIIDGTMVEDETSIDIALLDTLDGLIDVTSIFNRPSERINGGLATHPNPYFVTVLTSTSLVDMQRDWESLTDTYLSWNDMSLEFGGVLDFNSTWAPPHNLHREGLSADINRSRFSVASPGMEVLPKIDDGTPAGSRLRRQLSQVCSQNNGRLLRRAVDPNLHCEFRR